MKKKINSLIFLSLISIQLTACSKSISFVSPIRPSLEEISKETKDYYTPSTLSINRGYHTLEKMEFASFSIDKNYMATIELTGKKVEDDFLVRNLNINQLLPTLNYKTTQPDQFDAFNLLHQEYSRSAVSVPYGTRGDRYPHFETNLELGVPWTLKADFDFLPNPKIRPLRFDIVNNCLRPGLWEFSSGDGGGEIYHSWYNFPEGSYYQLVADLNQLPVDFIKKALQWNDSSAPLRLEKLRDIKINLGNELVSVHDDKITYSSQDARRKIQKKYVRILKDKSLIPADNLKDFTSQEVYMSEFIEPGIYSSTRYMKFDLRFLAKPTSVNFTLVTPKTFYPRATMDPANSKKEFLEFEIKLDQDTSIIVGNLDISLLVEQEDLELSGFGVGILKSVELSERRMLLYRSSPPPTYAYLTKTIKGTKHAINTHAVGLEQVFLRAHPNAEKPYLEVSITSYERITDLIKYHIEIPKILIRKFQTATERYTSPIYYTYRDDNIR